MPLLFLKRLLPATLLLAAAGLCWGGDLTVSAASSLGNAFKTIAQGYQARYPDARVALNFGASGALLQQLAKGAPVDVLATADQETMDMAVRQGLVAAGDRRNFARNTLVLIVPGDSPLAIARLYDLGLPAVRRIAIGHADSVPAGRYARAALAAAGLWPGLQSKAIGTQNVRQSLDYVARGEVDAGFVYATDAALMKDQVRVALEVPLAAPVSYPMALVAGSRHGEEARRFMAYVASPAAQAVLAGYGFKKP